MFQSIVDEYQADVQRSSALAPPNEERIDRIIGGAEYSDFMFDELSAHAGVATPNKDQKIGRKVAAAATFQQ